MSNSLTSLRGNERSWVNRSGRWPKMSEWVNRLFFWANRSLAHFWAKNERFVQKTDEWIPSPAYQLVQGKLESGSEFQSRFRILEKVHLQTDLDLQHCYTVQYTVQAVLYTLQVNICIISILKKEVVFPLITFFNCKPKQSSYGITSF